MRVVVLVAALALLQQAGQVSGSNRGSMDQAGRATSETDSKTQSVTEPSCLIRPSPSESCESSPPPGITYSKTALNWRQRVLAPLTGGKPATVTLTPCPIGVDTSSGAGYQVLISNGRDNEAVNVIASPEGALLGQRREQ